MSRAFLRTLALPLLLAVPLSLVPITVESLVRPAPAAQGSAAGPRAFGSASPARAALAARGIYNVLDFGARGDGKTDDTAAIQRTFDAAKAAIVSFNARSVIQFPPLRYHISKPITVPRHLDIQAIGQAELIGDGNDGLVSGEAWKINIRGLSFTNFGTALRMTTGNIDNAMINIEDCAFDKNCKLAIDTGSFDDSRSSILTVRNCFSEATRFLAAYTDILNIENCWVCHDGGNHESMVIDSRANITGSLFAPYGAIDRAQALDRCWIVFKSSELTRSLRVEGCRFSGEQGGGFTVLHNFAAGNPDYGAAIGRQICISFSDCELDTLASPDGRQSPIVLFAMPNAISIKNCSGTIARGLVSLAAGFTPPTPPRQGEMQRYSLEFDGPSRRMTNLLHDYSPQSPVPPGLLPFLRGGSAN